MLQRIKNLCFIAAFFGITSIAVSTAQAQKNEPPSGQFGLGIIDNGALGGLAGTYAINQNIQVGTELALRAGTGNTLFLFAPFVRYQFTSKVSPFVEGGFNIGYNGAATGGMFFGGGLAYYFNHSFGVHGDVDIVSVTFTTPSAIFFGWSIVRFGVDWYF